MNAVIPLPAPSFIRVDIDRNRAIINNIEIGLTAQQTDILAVLCEKPGAVIHEERLIARVNGSGYWDMDLGCLRSQISRMRRHLEPHAKIEHVRARGYWVDLA